MTREELRARIREGIGLRGHFAVTAGDLWAAFNSPGEDTSVPFNDALRGFAAVNGWEARRGQEGEADAITFRPSRAPESR